MTEYSINNGIKKVIFKKRTYHNSEEDDMLLIKTSNKHIIIYGIIFDPGEFSQLMETFILYLKNVSLSNGFTHLEKITAYSNRIQFTVFPIDKDTLRKSMYGINIHIPISLSIINTTDMPKIVVTDL